MICEICGTGKASKRVIIEGAWVWICEKCARELKVENIEKGEKKIKNQIKESRRVEEYLIDDKFYEKLRKYRESRKLKQKDMAKILGIKESLYKNLEEGRIKPSIEMAKRIEKLIGESIIIREEIIEKGENKNFKPRVSDVIDFEE
ncbi:helix-turn-helix domain-containing protein [Nanoarchaeota archaeon NZ13-N]|uniref:HTH cro/C1-type domain-containing protein n=1 Tax=Candidatus Nanoclepta minutus TaxID=1940235 RepID=A0A397WP35_9ARCH|nr:MAG: helix-turn-helix domain-containing protein [Nanoarchaeota archaeon NZ13-N]RIB35661.1 MAG: hypothetical protein BXU00_00985 [Candidatus Nanoclepta minutus]